MEKRLPILAWTLWAVPCFSQVVTYEGDSFPETQGWERDFYCTPERWLDDGWFFQFVEEDATKCGIGDAGDSDYYERMLTEFEGVDRFFIEWRMEATGPSTEIEGVGPASLVAWSLGGVNYRFTISRDLVRIIRDNLLPFVWVEIEANVAHIYRIELTNVGPEPVYQLYADAALLDEGIAEGQYPSFSPAITWRSFVWDDDSQSRWDYVRYGRTPDPQSADYDSNSSVDSFDAYFIEECIERSAAGEPAYPSCDWADVTDADGNGPDNAVTCADWFMVVSDLWTGPGDPPELEACIPSPIPAVSEWGMGVLGLLMLSLATVVYRNSLHHRLSFVRAN